MIIAKGSRDKGKTASRRRRSASAPEPAAQPANKRTSNLSKHEGCLISKSDIGNFIDKATHGQAVRICAMMVGVTKACRTAWPRCPLGKEKDHLHPSGLNLIAALQLLDPDPDLVTIILKPIEDAVGQGKRGIDAAYKTAVAIVNYTFREQQEWESLTKDFEAVLEQAGLQELLAAVDEVFD